MKHTIVAIAMLFLGSCGGDPSSSAAGLTGRWRAVLGGAGPLTAVLDRDIRADGTYEMTGYPSIAERGRYRVEGRDGNTLTLRLTERVSCGPCGPAGPDERREDTTEAIVIAPDGRSLTWSGERYTRQ